MKLKGAAKNMKAGLPAAVAAVLWGAFALLRAYQSLALIDPATGFFTNKSNITVPLFYILAVGAPLITLLLFYLCPLSKAEGIPIKRNLPHACAGLLLAALIVSDAIRQFTAPERTRLILVSGVLGVLAAASLVLTAVSFLSGAELLKKVKPLHVAPALWALTRTVSVFAVNAPYLRNSGLLTCLFADMFLMLFFFEYARKATAVLGDANSPAFLTTGFAAAGLQLAAFITGAVSLLPGRSAFLHAEFSAYRIAAALFCLTAVIIFFKHKAPDYVPHGREDAEKEIETHPLAAEAAPQANDTDEA